MTGAPAIAAFQVSTAFVRGLMGPLRGERPEACVTEILARAALAAPRPMRWAVVAPTEQDLRLSAMPLWHERAPKAMGKWDTDLGCPRHTLTGATPGGQRYALEVLFLVAAKPEHAGRLAELDLDGAWLTKARDVDRSVLDALTASVGTNGAGWAGVIFDTLPPEAPGHWLGQLPDGWELHRQPAGDGEYYERVRAGKDASWARVYLDGEFGDGGIGGIAPVLSQYFDDARRFVYEELGVLPFDHEPVAGAPQCEAWQETALDEIAAHDRVTIRAGHGVGKTATESWIVLWFLLSRPTCKIPITANTEDQLRDVVWSEIKKWRERLAPELRDWIVVTTSHVEIPGGAERFAVARTARKERPEALQGFHADYLLFIVEEASGVPEIIFDVALGAMSTPGAKTLLAANPTRISGYFFDTHRHPVLLQRWRRIQVSCEDVPRARGHIEDIIARYGKDSNAYRIRVLGDFPTAEDDTVVPLDLVEAAIRRAPDILDNPRIRTTWGLDVARFGADRSALAKRRHKRLIEPVTSWRGKDTMQTVGLLVDAYNQTPAEEQPAEILIDVIGIGAGVVDRARELNLPVRGINVAESASANARFLRLRDELWWKAREWFTGLDCALPAGCDVLVGELTAPTYEINSAGKVVIESKSDMKHRLGVSPDEADAFVLTMAGGVVRVEDVEDDRWARARRARRNSGRSWMTA